MTSPFAFTLLSAAAVFVAAVALMLWQILSAPDRPNYPTSGRVKRGLMFLMMAALFYRAIEIVYLARAPEPRFSTEGQVVASVLMAALFVTFLVDHLRHWLPARTHHNIRRLMRVAHCRPRPGLIAARTSAMVNSTGAPCPAADVVAPALVQLTLEGVAVVEPSAGPEVITGAAR